MIRPTGVGRIGPTGVRRDWQQEGGLGFRWARWPHCSVTPVIHLSPKQTHSLATGARRDPHPPPQPPKWQPWASTLTTELIREPLKSQVKASPQPAAQPSPSGQQEFKPSPKDGATEDLDQGCSKRFPTTAKNPGSGSLFEPRQAISYTNPCHLLPESTPSRRHLPISGRKEL